MLSHCNNLIKTKVPVFKREQINNSEGCSYQYTALPADILFSKTEVRQE